MAEVRPCRVIGFRRPKGFKYNYPRDAIPHLDFVFHIWSVVTPQIAPVANVYRWQCACINNRAGQAGERCINGGGGTTANDNPAIPLSAVEV